MGIALFLTHSYLLLAFFFMLVAVMGMLISGIRGSLISSTLRFARVDENGLHGRGSMFSRVRAHVRWEEIRSFTVHEHWRTIGVHGSSAIRLTRAIIQ